MAISLDSLNRGSARRMPRAILYGPHGAGKSTMLSSLPGAVIIQTEDGFDAINEEREDQGLAPIPSFPVARSFGDVMSALEAICETEEFSNLIIDSIDHMEPLVWAETCKRNGWATIETEGFGKGYVAADIVWQEFFEGVRYLRDSKNMGVFMTAHAQIKTFNDPQRAAYDRYSLKLHKRASALAQEWADQVWFLEHDVAVSEIKEGMGKRTVGKSAGTRTLHTENNAAFDAKHRGTIPAKVSVPKPPTPFDWSKVSGAFPRSTFEGE